MSMIELALSDYSRIMKLISLKSHGGIMEYNLNNEDIDDANKLNLDWQERVLSLLYSNNF